MRKTVVALATLLSMTTASAEWVATTGSSIPPGAFQGGVDSDGEPLYVCRASLNGGVQPGKTRKEFNGCNVPWGGKETAVPQYEVLVAWKATSGADIPNNALQVGQEKEGAPLYSCRAFHKGGVHIGKTRKEFKACNIAYGGAEVAVPAYEVLVK